ncbi:hypothetical protein ACRRTK_022338 [Alexandromys fortis]
MANLHQYTQYTLTSRSCALERPQTPEVTESPHSDNREKKPSLNPKAILGPLAAEWLQEVSYRHAPPRTLSDGRVKFQSLHHRHSQQKQKSCSHLMQPETAIPLPEECGTLKLPINCLTSRPWVDTASSSPSATSLGRPPINPVGAQSTSSMGDITESEFSQSCEALTLVLFFCFKDFHDAVLLEPQDLSICLRKPSPKTLQSSAAVDHLHVSSVDHLHVSSVDHLHVTTVVVPHQFRTWTVRENSHHLDAVPSSIHPQYHLDAVPTSIHPQHHLDAVPSSIHPQHHLDAVPTSTLSITWTLSPAPYTLSIIWTLSPPPYTLSITWTLSPAPYTLSITWMLSPPPPSASSGRCPHLHPQHHLDAVPSSIHPQHHLDTVPTSIHPQHHLDAVPTSTLSITWILSPPPPSASPGYCPHLHPQHHLDAVPTSTLSITWMLSPPPPSASPGHCPHLHPQHHLDTVLPTNISIT